MTTRDQIAQLLKTAAAAMKRDLKGAVAALESAYGLAQGAGDDEDTAVVAEELSRAWGRRKAFSKSLYFAIKATKLAPAQKATWVTLGKACELVATRTTSDTKRARARALYRAAATAFKKGASFAKDPEDKRWLQELARDAAVQGKPPST